MEIQLRHYKLDEIFLWITFFFIHSYTFYIFETNNQLNLVEILNRFCFLCFRIVRDLFKKSVFQVGAFFDFLDHRFMLCKCLHCCKDANPRHDKTAPRTVSTKRRVIRKMKNKKSALWKKLFETW